MKFTLSQRKKLAQTLAFQLFRILSWSLLLVLGVILGFIVVRGIGVISWDFLTKMPEEGMTQGGIFPAIVGTLCLVVGSMLFAFPVGVLSGIYLNEFVRESTFKRFLKLMTNNLAGVPSIIFGLFGMSLFVNTLGFGDSILAGSLTLGLLALPVIVRTTEESLKSIDNTYREASFALGASKIQTIRKVVLPMAMPNVLTGFILSVGRVSGETAPILFTVAAYFLPKLPSSLSDQVMALPYHLYVLSTSGTDMEASRGMAYGTAFILIMIVLILNTAANLTRNYLNKKNK